MNLFDLLFLAVVLGSTVVWVSAIVLAIRRRGRRALRLLAGWLALLAVYLIVVIAVSILSPQRVIEAGGAQCFDDWCISVNGVKELRNGSSTTYVVSLRLASRARRASQRENGLHVRLIDDQGRRFDPRKDPNEVPFNVLLGPGESVTAERIFDVPADAAGLSLVVRHGLGPGNVIIGDSQSLLHKPTLMRLR